MSLLIALELFAVFLISVVFIFYLYYRNCFTYWTKRGVPQLQPGFPVGDLASAAWGNESIYIRIQKLYHQFKDKGLRFGGIYFTNGPIFFPVQPDLIKSIMVSDFDHFIDRGMYVDEEKLPITAHMFSMKGERWRNMRNKFSPTFTSGKMKSMFNILKTITQQLVRTLEPHQQLEIDIKEILLRYTTDVIGSAAFGVDVDCLTNPETEFAQMVAKIFNPPRWKLLKMAFQEGLQNPGNLIKIAHDNQEVVMYFTDLVHKTVEYRDANKVVRDDFLNMMMQLRSAGTTMAEIVAQSFVLFTAGFETSSSTMSNCIHELAHNQEIQDRLREEIHGKLGRDSSKYTYDDVHALPLLDKCIKETLRKYPPVAMLNRICDKAYHVPDSDVVIEEGTPVIISTLGLHQDPEYFPDPLEFDPERFSDENSIRPFTYLPFGDGPRNCIGMRFGFMQTKLGLSTLLNHYKFLPSSKSPRHLAVDPSTTTIVFTILGGVHTRIIKI